MNTLSFGKPARPRNATAVATRKVQAWLTKQLGAWAEAKGGVVRAEEVECNIPGCAPIETLLSFYAEGANEFNKVGWVHSIYFAVSVTRWQQRPPHDPTT